MDGSIVKYISFWRLLFIGKVVFSSCQKVMLWDSQPTRSTVPERHYLTSFLCAWLIILNIWLNFFAEWSRIPSLTWKACSSFSKKTKRYFLKLASLWSLSLNAFFIVRFLNIVCVCSLAQVKDEVNAGNLLYKLGKLEFENVYFSYTNGSVHSWFL